MKRLRLFLLFLIVLAFAMQAFWPGDTGNNPALAATEITVAQLPPEGRATLLLIKQGGPYPYTRDGIVFGNREGLLPAQSRGYYHEYTVPTPGLSHRGPRRIVSAGSGGEYWYSADHYRSFQRIRE